MRRTVFRVKSNRIAFLLNRLMAAGVALDRIERGEGTISFAVRLKDAKPVCALLSEIGASYEIFGFRGLKSLLFAARKRPFLIAAMILAVIGVIFFENFIYTYSIAGNRYVNTEEVAEVLRANGVSGLVYKGSLDLPKIKRQVSAIEGISFASVKVVGSRLQVTVKEELPREDPETPRFDPILSQYDAVVTKVVAESGTPRVKAGERVLPGTLLIEPFYAFTEGGAEAPARGEVWGEVTYRKEIFLPAFYLERVRTGEVFSERQVSIFGRGIGKVKEPPFPLYEREEKKIYHGFGTEITLVRYHRMEEELLHRDLDQEGGVLLLRAERELLLSVPFYARERGTISVTEKKVDNIIVIVLYYTVEQRIDLL